MITRDELRWLFTYLREAWHDWWGDVKYYRARQHSVHKGNGSEVDPLITGGSRILMAPSDSVPSSLADVIDINTFQPKPGWTDIGRVTDYDPEEPA